MTWPVVWQDENGEELGRFDDPGFLPELLPPADERPPTACLRFIDPYGDTVFNQAQLHELLRELEMRRARIGEPGVLRGLDRLLEFLRSCTDQTHTYIKVVGD